MNILVLQLLKIMMMILWSHELRVEKDEELMVMGKEEVEKKEVEKVEKEEELMVMEKEEVETREVTFVSLVDSMPPAPDTAPTASTVQQGRSAGLPAG